MTKVFDYELVYNYLLNLINTELKEHNRIPSENTLCEKFKLSRLTVRQGINKLKNEGYLYSRRGSGNFVNPKKITYTISSNTTFTNEIIKLNKVPSIKLLEMKTIKANKEIATKLNIRLSEEVLYIKNLRFVDDIPFLFAEYYMNKAPLPNIENLISSVNSISKLYKDTYKLEPLRERSDIDITSTNYISKQIFNVQNDLPIIKISTKTTDKKSNQTIDYCYSYFRSDMTKIIVDYKDNNND
ncbi:GntR family transcriptional regulator [Arcobacter sp.]|uniref:GntR family transcriptional regulator n=1 Tax=Arcobacter sp. TaxID=1872629 RepID=UPI003D0E47AB